MLLETWNSLQVSFSTKGKGSGSVCVSRKIALISLYTCGVGLGKSF